MPALGNFTSTAATTDANIYYSNSQGGVGQFGSLGTVCSVFHVTSSSLSQVSQQENPCVVLRLYCSIHACQTFPNHFPFCSHLGNTSHAIQKCPHTSHCLDGKLQYFCSRSTRPFSSWRHSHSSGLSPAQGTTSKHPPSSAWELQVDRRSIGGLWSVPPGTRPCEKVTGHPGPRGLAQAALGAAHAGPDTDCAAVCRTALYINKWLQPPGLSPALNCHLTTQTIHSASLWMMKTQEPSAGIVCAPL